MKKMYLILITLLFVEFQNLSAQVVINEIYGGGGNTGATYTNDFIELFNNGNADVDLTGWSVQYASAAGASWQVTVLNGTIPAHGHYLVQELAGTGGTTGLPTPNATGVIPMSATGGKIALCSNITALTTTAPSGGAIVDFVGFGSAGTFEGTGATVAPSNTTSVQRSPEGHDTDDNKADFPTAGTPTPLNSTGTSDTTPPTVVSFSAADDATGVATNSVLSITFSENIFASAGFITVNNATNGTFDYVDPLTPNVSISGTTVTITGVNFQPGKDYFITIPDSIFKDLAGNKYAGTTDNTTWNFSTNATAATPVNGILGQTYNLNSCGTTFGSDGFTQYSVTGGLTWACTTFGRDAANAPKGNAPSGLQMNGFDIRTQTNVVNEDWLFLPRFDLTGTNFPLLSFYSRTKFNGASLQLKVSTDYPGFGDPRNFTWTDINGRFPGQTSDTWTQSSQVNLQAFNQSSAVYIAFVYTSTNDDGERWTLDDISVTNSLTAPPPTYTLSTTDMQFPYTAAASTSTKSFTLTGNDLVSGGGGINLTATGSFLLSKDNTTFASTINYTEAEANNTSQNVFVQFAPALNDQNFTGVITINTSGVNDTTVNVTGTSIDPAKTLEVVNWNMEWFGSPDPTLGPVDKALQKQNAQTMLQNIGADLFALVEVVDTAALGDIVRNHLTGYSYIICNYGSHGNPFESGASPLNQLQKEAFVYKTDMFSNIDTTSLLSVGVNTAADLSNPDYNFWSSGRYPFMMTADVNLNGDVKRIHFVAVHAKANTSPTTTSYNRRKSGANDLYNYLSTTFPADNIVILGDFNDDLDSTITDGITPRLSSWKIFTDDVANFYSPTLNGLSLTGKKSTTGFNDVIDHVVVSNEMQPFFMKGSAAVLTDKASLITNYATTTSDHFPVFTRYAFDAALLPIKLISFTAAKQNNSVKLSWETSEEINSKEFVVLRSADGSNFTAIGTVFAKGVPSVYSLIDAAPLTGNNFYKLQLVDKDNKYAYSQIVKVNFNKELSIRITPNPASTVVDIRVDNANSTITLQVIDLNGKMVRQQVIQPNSASSTLDVSKLAKGLYTMKIISPVQVSTQKLVIQ